MYNHRQAPGTLTCACHALNNAIGQMSAGFTDFETLTQGMGEWGGTATGPWGADHIREVATYFSITAKPLPAFLFPMSADDVKASPWTSLLLLEDSHWTTMKKKRASPERVEDFAVLLNSFCTRQPVFTAAGVAAHANRLHGCGGRVVGVFPSADTVATATAVRGTPVPTAEVAPAAARTPAGQTSAAPPEVVALRAKLAANEKRIHDAEERREKREAGLAVRVAVVERQLLESGPKWAMDLMSARTPVRQGGGAKRRWNGLAGGGGRGGRTGPARRDIAGGKGSHSCSPEDSSGSSGSGSGGEEPVAFFPDWQVYLPPGMAP